MPKDKKYKNKQGLSETQKRRLRGPTTGKGEKVKTKKKSATKKPTKKKGKGTATSAEGAGRAIMKRKMKNI